MWCVFFSVIILILLPYFYYKKPDTKLENTDYDAILILGYPATTEGICSPILKARLDKAIELYEMGICTKLVCSGGNIHNHYSEAKIMNDYAITHGIAQEDIYLETKAANTYQNIKFSLDILKQHHLNKVLIITSPWHLRKASHCAKLYQLNFKMVSSNYPPHFTFVHIIVVYLYSYFNLYYNMLYSFIKK